MALLAVALAVPAFAGGLDPGKALTQYSLDAWTTANGLPQNNVTAIAQTKDGYLWIGTFAGLARFDGARFVILDKGSAPALGNSGVGTLLPDKDGGLWIGTNGGLARYRGGILETFTTRDGLAGNVVRALYQDRAGALWVGTNDGLSRFENGHFRSWTARDGLTNNVVRAIQEDRGGTLWIGTNGGGLCGFDAERFSCYGRKEGLPSEFVFSLLEDKEGTLWVGTNGAGLARREGDRFRAFGPKDGLLGEVVWSLFEDAQGSLWVGTYGAGVYRREGERFRGLTTSSGLASDFVRALGQDREGSLWIGTSTGGLARLRDGKFTTYTTREGLPSDLVRVVLEDHRADVWIGTSGGGVARLRNGAFTVWGKKEGLPDAFVQSLFEDRRGNLWVGTNGGLARVKDERIEVFSTRDGLVDDHISTIVEDRAGTVWIGTRAGGLSKYEAGRFTPVTRKDGLAADLVLATIVGRDGVLWVGTDGSGVTRIVDGVFTTFTTKDGLAGDIVLSFYEDAEGALWIGTSGGGLSCFRDGHFTSFSTRDGLHEDVVFVILEDSEGNLWLSGNRGISKVKKAALLARAAGKGGPLDVVVYGLADGMKSSECGGISQPAGTRSHDGRLWFPTTHGVAMIDPAHIATNEVAPPVRIEGLVAGGHEYDGDGPFVLPAGAQNWEVRYTALSLLAPEKVSFKYRLLGLDEDWVMAEHRRTAFYTHVPPGNYTFQAAASNDDGVWNAEGASVAIRVSPRFHETWLFYTLVTAAVLVAALAVYTSRVRGGESRRRALEAVVAERTRELREEKERTEAQRGEAERLRELAERASQAKSMFVASMSHELRTPLNAILGFVQLLDRDRHMGAEQREQLSMIARSGEHLLGLINDVLSLAKVEAGQIALAEAPFELGGLLREVMDLLGKRAEAKGLRLTLETSGGIPEMVFGDEKKLRQILLNLMGNALKFTSRGGVTLRVEWRVGRGIFEIVDTGPGIDEAELPRLFAAFAQAEAGRRSQEGTGLGLMLSRSYARLMGGDVTVSSRLGTGSVFRVEVSLPLAVGVLESWRGGRRRRVVGMAEGCGPFRALVVDDVLENRVLLARMLALVGFEVQEAEGGAEALERCRTTVPDLVLLDLRMPGMDGEAAARAIRGAESGHFVRRTKIVAVSASVLPEERRGLHAAGFDGFLPKPIEEDSLYRLLAELLALEWRYEDRAFPPAEAGAVGSSEVPTEIRERLLAAARAADVETTASVVEALRAGQPAAADELMALLRRYAFDEIEEWAAGRPGQG